MIIFDVQWPAATSGAAMATSEPADPQDAGGRVAKPADVAGGAPVTAGEGELRRGHRPPLSEDVADCRGKPGGAGTDPARETFPATVPGHRRPLAAPVGPHCQEARARRPVFKLLLRGQP